MHDAAREAIQELLLTDRCVITESPDNTQGTLNTSTLAVVRDSPAEVFAGPCKISAGASSRYARTGGEELQVDESVLSVPVSAPRLRPGMLVTVASSDASLDGAQFTIDRFEADTHTASRSAVVKRRVAHPAPGGDG